VALGAELRARGVATGVHYPLSLPEQPALAQLAATDAPIARDWAARELSLPIFPEMTEAQLEVVTGALSDSLTGARV
jgi:dTDP-4-amino-4,6-dideoxygalactose transaminase